MLAVFIELEVIEAVVSGFLFILFFFFFFCIHPLRCMEVLYLSTLEEGGTKWEAHITRMSWQWGKGQHFCWQMLLLFG